MASTRLGSVCILTLTCLVGIPAAVGGESKAETQLLAAAEAANLRGAWVKAEALYTQVVAQNPGSAEGQTGLAFVLAEQGRLQDAAARYRIALEVSPRDTWTLYNLATVVDATDPRRALGLWHQYVAAAADDPAERSYVQRARGRIRQLTAR